MRTLRHHHLLICCDVLVTCSSIIACVNSVDYYVDYMEKEIVIRLCAHKD